MPTTLQDSITRIVTYPHPIDRVWDAITNPGHLAHWMCSTVEPFTLEPGEVIHFAWDNERYRARITLVEPPATLAWRWRPGSGEDSTRSLEEQGPLTTVTFHLESVPGGTRLTLTETGFTALSEARNRSALTENNEGWDDCLGRLQAHLEATSAR